ncbi:MAG: autotransporter [Oscillatoriaceae cyanobacterium Prado104]|nr:autotransporter [Oscillatoriaceae cyanobacterium Prado104]
MGFQNIKLLTGASLSVLVSALSVPPAIANPAIQIAQTQTVTANAETVTGIVKSIVGNVITIKPENERYRTLRIQTCVLRITSLVPGMKVQASIVGGSQIESIMVVPNVKVTATTVQRTVTPRVETPPAPPPIPAPAPRPAPPPRVQPAVPPRPAPAPRPAPRPVRGLW